MNTQELRELDAWIAEHVMREFVGNPAKGEACDDVVYEDKDRTSVKGMLKHYTTDPAAAMAVLEKLMHHHGAMRLHKVKDNEWMIQTLAFGYGGQFAFEETLSLAICKLAKKLFTP